MNNKSWDQSVAQVTTIQPKVKYVLYARKSSESEEKQVLSIDSQVKEMLQIAERESLEIVDIRRESHSAKDSGQRPVFSEILTDIRNGRYTGILTWAPDRLSRNAGDLGSLVDLMDQKLLWGIRTYGQHFTNSPNEKFMLMLLCSTAKLENDNKSVNVKRGLRTRCEMGLWPAPAPTGYLNQKIIDKKCEVIVDSQRAQIIRQIFEKIAYQKWSGRRIYHWLKFDLNFRSVTSNKPLTLSNVYTIIQNHFYYGVFEYPKNSGNWYTGKHEPIITRELFEQANEQLKRDKIVRGENKEFAFTRLMNCGLCKSGICAEEKFKTLKTTNTITRYVYYGCTRSKDLHCKGGYITEENLIEQFINLIEKIDLDEFGIKSKLKKEMERFNKFSKIVYGEVKSDKEQEDFSLKQYAKYILKEGTVYEKRDLLTNLKSRIYLKNKIVTIENKEANLNNKKLVV